MFALITLIACSASQIVDDAWSPDTAADTAADEPLLYDYEVEEEVVAPTMHLTYYSSALAPDPPLEVALEGGVDDYELGITMMNAIRRRYYDLDYNTYFDEDCYSRMDVADNCHDLRSDGGYIGLEDRDVSRWNWTRFPPDEADKFVLLLREAHSNRCWLYTLDARTYLNNHHYDDAGCERTVGKLTFVRG